MKFKKKSAIHNRWLHSESTTKSYDLYIEIVEFCEYCSQRRSSIFSCYRIYICLCFAKISIRFALRIIGKRLTSYYLEGPMVSWNDTIEKLFSVFNDLTVRPWQSSLTSNDKMQHHSEIVVIYIYIYILY